MHHSNTPLVSVPLSIPRSVLTTKNLRWLPVHLLVPPSPLRLHPYSYLLPHYFLLLPHPFLSPSISYITSLFPSTTVRLPTTSSLTLIYYHSPYFTMAGSSCGATSPSCRFISDGTREVPRYHGCATLDDVYCVSLLFMSGWYVYVGMAVLLVLVLDS